MNDLVNTFMLYFVNDSVEYMGQLGNSSIGADLDLLVHILLFSIRDLLIKGYFSCRLLAAQLVTLMKKTMGSEIGDNDLVVTQISVGGLESYVTAKMLLDYFEDNIGLVWRCRLKTSSTPPESNPNYEIDAESVQRKIDYVKIEPHAFVHFAVAHSAKAALDAAGRGELILGRKPLKVSLGPQNPHRMNERRRTTTPYKLSDILIEAGVMRSRDEFLVGWRGPRTGVDFLVDPFNGTCKLHFTKDTAFSFKGEARSAVIKCNFKIEFLPREINEITQYKDFSSLIVLLQLASSPLLYYRTADDDIEESVPFDLLDDDDPWIRTTDFTPSGAIGRTLRVQDEPDFGMPMSDPFFCLQYKEGINFKIMFLVNAVVHRGIINQHQMSEKFFDLLRSQPEELNIVTLKHMCTYKHPVYDAIKSLDFVQKWLLNNPKLLEKPREMDDVVEQIKRDRSAWFFAEDKNTGVANIKSWMGKFTQRNVAKCAARMGQCFSSTYATIEVPLAEVSSQFPDVERNGYVFSDGIGMISADLAIEVAEKLQLGSNPPCAYQIRYAGYKGVVARWPAKDDGIRLYLRRSMKKFESNHKTLEICSWTRFQPGFLNRQIITLLSALEVRDDVFWRMQETMVSRLDWMLEDSDTAFDVLTASCTDQGNTAAIMLSAGFRPQTEPHLRGMLTSIRAAQLGDLRERARIFVPLGRWLMGCLDELDKLEHGQCFIQVSNPSIEDCFVKHGSQFSETKKKLKVVTGLVAIAKNPCLHPGDVRILEAVDVPELHHLYDCLVFPQKGDRPHTNEASGSDLDGDLYFVTWDENLIPPSKRSWTPMEYAPGEVKQLPREVKHSDIIDFFTRNMVNESLGTICNAHVVHADLSEYGALDEKCIKLAELAATAVDFPKTGKIVNMPAELKPKMYPDFMGKEEFQSYNSNKILGKLYRKIKDAYDRDHEASPEHTFASDDIIYNQDLEVAGSTSFIADAWNCKCSYDGQLIGLLGQYKVNREEEVVTGHIWSMPKYSSKKQGEVKERLKHAYSTLRKEFRKVFECMGPEFDQFSDDEKNIMYERKASAWYQVTYQESWVKKSKELHAVDDAGKSVMLSFAWIAADYLARIKIKRRMMEIVSPLSRLILWEGTWLTKYDSDVVFTLFEEVLESYICSFLLFGYKATLPWKLNSWSSPNSHDMGIATLTLPTSSSFVLLCSGSVVKVMDM
ncbi:UNVERIFIED_CONTAM: RNA-dependent RNA polymerase 6 [Sesamum calycinum]|uniref:RNA-dependent RNA polymerase n=1 Tax=Sesamum calycinum TaxID=2727403 RepID=A0AAW2L715_9LAMI